MLLSFSQQAKWFAYHVVDTGGVVAEDARVPCGQVCLICGTTLECWPLSLQDDLIARFIGEREFREVVLTVRAGVANAATHAFRFQSVFGDKVFGERVHISSAFIPVDMFAAWYGCTPESVSGKLEKGELKRGSYLLPDNTTAEGVVLNFHELPPGLPHYIVEQYSYQQKRFEDQLLRAEDIRRVGQPVDRFHYAVQGMVKDRWCQLRAGSTDLISNNAITLAANTIQREREAAAAEGTTALRAGVVPVATRVETSSTLNENPSMPVVASAAATRAPRQACVRAPGTPRGPRIAPTRIDFGSATRLSDWVPLANGGVGDAASTSGESCTLGPVGGRGPLSATAGRAPAGVAISQELVLDKVAILRGWNAGREIKKVPNYTCVEYYSSCLFNRSAHSAGLGLFGWWVDWLV